eukprot:gene35005-biopygen28366
MESSSHALDQRRMHGVHLSAAGFSNLTQDHLDWHGSMQAYAGAKARIFGQRGMMVLNREDATVMAMRPEPVRVRLQKPQERAYISFGTD